MATAEKKTGTSVDVVSRPTVTKDAWTAENATNLKFAWDWLSLTWTAAVASNLKFEWAMDDADLHTAANATNLKFEWDIYENITTAENATNLKFEWRMGNTGAGTWSTESGNSTAWGSE